jgi:DNA-binding protein H-NS
VIERDSTILKERRKVEELQASIAEQQATITQLKKDFGATIAQLTAASRRAGVPNPKSERAARSEQVRHRTNPPWWTCTASGCEQT